VIPLKVKPVPSEQTLRSENPRRGYSLFLPTNQPFPVFNICCNMFGPFTVRSDLCLTSALCTTGHNTIEQPPASSRKIYQAVEANRRSSETTSMTKHTTKIERFSIEHGPSSCREYWTSYLGNASNHADSVLETNFRLLPRLNEPEWAVIVGSARSSLSNNNWHPHLWYDETCTTWVRT